jgi:hypothetical protein
MIIGRDLLTELGIVIQFRRNEVGTSNYNYERSFATPSL